MGHFCPNEPKTENKIVVTVIVSKYNMEGRPPLRTVAAAIIPKDTGAM